jgi:hypothetical protein
MRVRLFLLKTPFFQQLMGFFVPIAKRIRYQRPTIQYLFLPAINSKNMVKQGEHQIRSTFSIVFLQELERAGEITIGANGRVYGLEACLRRLVNFRRERAARDWEIVRQLELSKRQEIPK